MAMREQAINIALKPMNEQAPHSAGPMGRLARIENGQARKFLGGSLRVSKRPGSTSLSSTTYLNGTVTTMPTNPKMLAAWGSALLFVGGTSCYGRSESANAWEQLPGTIATQTLSKRAVYNSYVAFAPDAAAVGNTLCTVLKSNVYGELVKFEDVDGVQIRAPFAPSGTSRAKVVSDGTNFWVFSMAAARFDTFIQVFDVHGTQVAASSVTWGATARDKWDVGYQAANGMVFLVTPTGATTTVQYMHLVAGVITVATTATPAIDSTGGVARLENNQGGTNIYIASLNAGNDVTPYEITSTGTIGHTYPTAVTATLGVNNVTGFVVNSSFDVKVLVSVLADNTASPSTAALNNKVVVATQTRAGGSTLATVRSLALVSRAFTDLDGVYRVVLYYQSTSESQGDNASPGGAQPTFFVYDIASATPVVVGQFDTGFAYAYYATSRVSGNFYPWHLSSAAVDGTLRHDIHIPLGYLSTTTSTGVGLFASLTGINDYVISTKHGRPVSTTDGLMLPGLQADYFDGASVGEWGIQLAPEIVSLAGGVGGNQTLLSTPVYVGVWEWTDSHGNLYQSPLSAPLKVTLAGSKNQVTVTFATDRTSTKTGLVFVLYRTFSPTLTGTTPGLILRRVIGVANDPTVDTLFTIDILPDTTVALGQDCYSQPLNTAAPVALEYFAPPPFSRGVTADGRDFVIGYDKAIWFSFPKTEGQGIAFNPAFRMLLPTPAMPVDIVAMDTRVAIFCDDGTQWTADMGNLPNATLTSGSIPTPQQVPATTGATSAALLIPTGAVFGAKSGAWLMDRSVSSRFIGSPVVDEIDAETQVVDIAVGADQRVYFTLGTNGIIGNHNTALVLDLVSNCWYVWRLPSAVYASTTWNGVFLFADSAGVVHAMDSDETTDYTDDGAAISSIYELASIDFAGVNGYESVWEVQFYGSYLGPHTVNVDVKFDQGDGVSQTFMQAVPTDPVIYRWDFLANQIDCQAIGLVFYDSFPGVTPGNSFALEAIGMLVGVESGLGRIVPTTRRIPA